MLIKRVIGSMAKDLKTAYRPCTLDELLGNEKVKTILKRRLQANNLTHTMLFSGQSSTGKTTTARIIALSLNCTETEDPAVPCLKCPACTSILTQNSVDVVEVNVGSDSGKAEVAAIVSDVALAPFQLRNKVIIFDEAHKLTTAAKDLLLKVMEDTYAHVYFIFCTDEPAKLASKNKKEDPFLNRCDHFKFMPLTDEEIYQMLENISQFEGVPYTEEVLLLIAELSGGIPRKALNALGQIISNNTWDIGSVRELLDEQDEIPPELLDLSRLLFKGMYTKSVTLYGKLVRKYDTETIRITVTGYFVGCLKKEKNLAKGLRISKALDVLLEPILVSGKQAEHRFYNVIFKVAVVMMKK